MNSPSPFLKRPCVLHVEAQVNSAVARRAKCLYMRGRAVTMETSGNHVVNNLAFRGFQTQRDQEIREPGNIGILLVFGYVACLYRF